MTVQTDYLADVPKTDLMRVIVALSTEVYEMKVRMNTLEGILIANGTDLESLDYPAEPAAFNTKNQEQRDAFVERIFGSLANL